MKAFLLIFFGLALSSCAMVPPELPKREVAQPEVQPKASALTPGMVKKHIEVKKTTQAEILEIFGPPDMITKSGPAEMWGYDKVSREVAEAAFGARSAAGGSVGAGGLGLVGGAGGGVLGGVLGGLGGSYGQSVEQSSQERRRTVSTTTLFLLVYFDEKGVVSDYKLSATKF